MRLASAAAGMGVRIDQWAGLPDKDVKARLSAFVSLTSKTAERAG